MQRKQFLQLLGASGCFLQPLASQTPTPQGPTPQSPAQRPHSSDPRLRRGYLLQFQLGETPAEVERLMGPPAQVADLGPGYQTWLYQVHVHDKHEFSHTFCFKMPEQKLISVLRQMEWEEPVEALFPPAETTTHYWPDEQTPRYSARVRWLDNGRYLVAMGSGKPGQTCSQLYLVQQSAMEIFHTWLAADMKAKPLSRGVQKAAITAK